MTASLTVPRGAAVVHLPSPFVLQGGGVLHSGVLAYERQGPPGAPAVVVCGGISAGRHVSTHANDPRPGFWDGVVGDGCAIDTSVVQVLAVDWLGGAGGSSAPAGDDDAFPSVATADQADAIAHLLDDLGIERLRAWVGSSYGGMVGLAFAARHRERLDRLLAIAAADCTHALASAWRRVQRGIVALGLRRGCADEALALARQLAMTTYRSAGELAARFGGDAGALQGWLDRHGSAFAQRFAARAFLCLCESIDAHRVDPAAVRVPAWLCSFATDQLVPPWQVRALADALPDCRAHVELDTPFGHDAFLKERERLAPLLREVLS